jgi:Flp pilus assembly protein TadD
MTQRRHRELLVCGASLLLAGCAPKEYTAYSPDRANWLKADENAANSAGEVKDPSVLPRTHFAAGQLFEQQGELRRAIVQYQKAIAAGPDHVGAYNRLGVLFGRMGRHADAEQALRKAVELRPDWAFLRNNLAFEYMLQERWADAEAELRNAVRLQPQFARAHNNLAVTLFKQERFEEALQEFRQAVPEPDAYYNLGLMFRADGRLRDAADAFEQVISLAPQFTAAQTQLAQLAPHVQSKAPAATGVELNGVTVTENDVPAAAPEPVAVVAEVPAMVVAAEETIVAVDEIDPAAPATNDEVVVAEVSAPEAVAPATVEVPVADVVAENAVVVVDEIEPVAPAVNDAVVVADVPAPEVAEAVTVEVPAADVVAEEAVVAMDEIDPATPAVEEVAVVAVTEIVPDAPAVEEAAVVAENIAVVDAPAPAMAAEEVVVALNEDSPSVPDAATEVAADAVPVAYAEFLAPEVAAPETINPPIVAMIDEGADVVPAEEPSSEPVVENDRLAADIRIDEVVDAAVVDEPTPAAGVAEADLPVEAPVAALVTSDEGAPAVDEPVAVVAESDHAVAEEAEIPGEIVVAAFVVPDEVPVAAEEPFPSDVVALVPALGVKPAEAITADLLGVVDTAAAWESEALAALVEEPQMELSAATLASIIDGILPPMHRHAEVSGNLLAGPEGAAPWLNDEVYLFPDIPVTEPALRPTLPDPVRVEPRRPTREPRVREFHDLYSEDRPCPMPPFGGE